MPEAPAAGSSRDRLWTDRHAFGTQARDSRRYRPRWGRSRVPLPGWASRCSHVQAGPGRMSRKSKQKDARLLRPGIVVGLIRELKAAAKDDRPLAVAGAPSLASVLRRDLEAGGDPRAVR